MEKQTDPGTYYEEFPLPSLDTLEEPIPDLSKLEEDVARQKRRIEQLINISEMF